MDVTAILYALLVLGALGLVFGIVLGIADKKFFVPADERVERIRACLPGANCGACGFAGCDAYADAVASGKVLPNCCPVGGSAAACAIGDVIGCAVEVSEPVRARVLCQGTTTEAVQKYKISTATWRTW
ncbi:MAG TPA: RnfABCDGE type electron transport complex subunit B, partial [Clostridia bacterium]|nr:RnfABCDGE type electron transport complex subunit B [Clostridia bacterium]